MTALLDGNAVAVDRGKRCSNVAYPEVGGNVSKRSPVVRI